MAETPPQPALPDVDVPRAKTLEAGLGLVIVAAPLFFLPASHAPFADVKHLIMVVGTFMIAASGIRADRRYALLGGAWFGSLVLASLVGVDPIRSLLGSEEQGVGIVTFACAIALISLGPQIPPSLKERAAVWLVGVGCAVAAISIGEATVPHLFPVRIWGSVPRGSTFGQTVLVGAFVGAALCAGTALRIGQRRHALVVLLLSFGITMTANRSGLIGAVLGLSWIAVRDPARRILASASLAALVAVAIGMAFVPSGRDGYEFSGARRLGEVGAGSSALERPAVWSASIRAWSRRPVFGWGPSNTHGAYLSSATPDELRRGTRNYADAHNIFVESVLTTGIAGLAPLLALFVLATNGALGRRAGPSWAGGAALVLAVSHLLQPLNVALTPLFFLLLGLASGSGRQTRIPRAVPTLLLLGSMLAVLRAGSATAEYWGRSYDSLPALQTSLRLEPWRFSTSEAFALQRATEGRLGFPGAGAEARDTIAGAIAIHPWHTHLRLVAADVELLLREPDGAEHFLREHLEFFPNDPEALFGVAYFAMARGDAARALPLAERAAAILPSGRNVKLREDARRLAR